MKKKLIIPAIAGVMIFSALAPVKTQAATITKEQYKTQVMLIQQAPFAQAQANVLEKINKVEQLKKKGASVEAIMAAQAEADVACSIMNSMTDATFNPLTYYGVYPMSNKPGYDSLAYDNMFDYRLAVLHDTNLVKKTDLDARSAQEIATNTLWLWNERKEELRMMEVKASTNPTLLPQVEELKAMCAAYEAQYLEQQNLANQKKVEFINTVNTFPSTPQRDGANAYSYLAP